MQTNKQINYLKQKINHLTKENHEIKEAYQKLSNEKENEKRIPSPDYAGQLHQFRNIEKNQRQYINNSSAKIGPQNCAKNNGFQLDHKVESLNAKTASTASTRVTLGDLTASAMKRREEEVVNVVNNISTMKMSSNLMDNRYNQTLFNKNNDNNRNINKFT